MANSEDTRLALEAAIENALAMLDALDQDPDFEPEEEDHSASEDDVAYGGNYPADDRNLCWDREPTLGATTAFNQHRWGKSKWDAWFGLEDGELEMSLGSLMANWWESQARWAFGRNDDREEAHDGREPDVDDELSGDESEPLLGATVTFDQSQWGAAGHCPWGVADREEESDFEPVDYAE